ncbi:MAG TPA: Glu-tRNA(Gln) amidotransferase subunit GatD [Thermoplasmatales archaeon]|nr:Glu-tRNA(Gln) amidotransferase subunit GatD [Thermoplasmatales archaeon]
MVEVGDKVEIRKNGKIYRGIVMPHHAFSDKNIVVIKLENGYNIGIDLRGCELKIIEKITGRIKRKFGKIPSNKKKPYIALLGTGGTIASCVDYETGAVYPASTPEELAFAVPEIFELCNVETKILFQKLSEDIIPKDWQRMAIETAKYLNSGKPVIIAHGTDTMSYSATALAFMLKNLNFPVVFVGSQRSSDRPSSDAFINLISAVRVALTDIGEVVVTMHSNISSDGCFIHRATKVRKMHSSRRDAFISINTKPIGKVENGTLEFYTEYKKVSGEKVKVMSKLDENVALIYYYPGFKKEDFEKITEDKNGIVIAGTGLGHIKADFIKIIKKLVKDGIPVVMTTQCIQGKVNMNVYSNGRKLLKAGVIGGEDMLPETALIKLMWVLANEENVEEAMKKNIAGEISERREIGAKNLYEM